MTDVNQSSRGAISGLWEGPWSSAWFYCGGGLVCLGKIDTKHLPADAGIFSKARLWTESRGPVSALPERAKLCVKLPRGLDELEHSSSSDSE